MLGSFRKFHSLLKSYCGEPSAALRGTRNLGYLSGMPRLLRSGRLASGLPYDVFQQPVIPVSNQSGIFVGSSSAPQHTNSVRLRRLDPRRLDVIFDLKPELDEKLL
jgi:hypothetical protein